MNDLYMITKYFYQLVAKIDRSLVYYGCKERGAMNQKQIANEQISRTSGEPKQTALEERQMHKNFGVEATANAVVEVSPK
jgi:hypothetical protein